MTELRYQIVIAGPGSVGKSAITLQFISQQFIRDYDPTIEECYKKHIYVDSEVAYLDILDTAGQEEYSSLRSHHFQNGDGFLLIYSVDNRKAFEEIVDFHDEILRAKDSDSLPIVLLANKIDLPKNNHEVSKKEGKDLADSYGYPFMETSAKNVINIEESFAECVRSIRKERAALEQKSGGKGKKGKGKCLLM
ncbi:ras gtpase-related [Anaeramoeba flamelloides]|uniref:small monomeric GTPase n=1 Tax=Anaeramoeba flamelloides TaxID=1746091 RepID=A0AAV8A5Q5_9EUKA|nr:ras gtpase-related [Anaeramoeba flamelloides]KAJ6253685.1 ras gtpase-related [Anaeramoeba flamelloides]